jgi:hypothetical protein
MPNVGKGLARPPSLPWPGRRRGEGHVMSRAPRRGVLGSIGRAYRVECARRCDDLCAGWRAAAAGVAAARPARARGELLLDRPPSGRRLRERCPVCLLDGSRKVHADGPAAHARFPRRTRGGALRAPNRQQPPADHRRSKQALKREQFSEPPKINLSRARNTNPQVASFPLGAAAAAQTHGRSTRQGASAVPPVVPTSFFRGVTEPFPTGPGRPPR